MGIIFKQSLSNTIITYAAFALGGINALFLYTYWMSEQNYGLITFLLSSANIVMPLMAFGVQHSIIKFYSSYTSEKEQDKMLFMALVLPLFIAIPIALIGGFFYEQLSILLSRKNPIIENYVYIIYVIGLLTAYFEIFYSWSRVQLKSVFGNTMKEFFTRVVVMLLLILVYFRVIDEIQFIYALTLSYVLRTAIMMGYAFYVRQPKFTFTFPENFKSILRYSFYIILAGTAGSMVLDIDKFMIPQKIEVSQTAFYAVAVYLGSVIEVPGRAMSQIIQPITALAINEKNHRELKSLYKKSHINLFVISGLIFLLINANINALYEIIPEKYSGGVWVVLMISIAKLSHMFLGNNGAIISNSKYYRILLPYSVLMSLAVVVLNIFLINYFGINGAALSTLIVVLVFNYIKLWYVKYKFDLVPYTNKTIWVFISIIVLFFLFSFWDFPVHPIISIVLKSLIISSVYLFLIIKFNLSIELIGIWEKIKK